jgi:hydroxymethylpyrimidine/phosphomethylpyrimidine kinase
MRDDSRPARVLSIAGSDSGGGAGIQADIATIGALRAYAMTAITAITVQNTTGVYGVHGVPPEIVAAQIAAVLSDIGADAIKTGMLVSAATVEAVADALQPSCLPSPPSLAARQPCPQAGEEKNGATVSSPVHRGGVRQSRDWATTDGGRNIPLLVDPVMIAKGGAALLDPAGIEAMRCLLFPMARLVTPNAPEAARLTGLGVENADDLARAGEALVRSGARAVLVKGGHLKGETVTDVLVDETGIRRFESSRLSSPHTHGTGCTLACAIATGLAQGLPLTDSIERARAFVRDAIRTGLAFGRGTGPVNPLGLG